MSQPRIRFFVALFAATAGLLFLADALILWVRHAELAPVPLFIGMALLALAVWYRRSR